MDRYAKIREASRSDARVMVTEWRRGGSDLIALVNECENALLALWKPLNDRQWLLVRMEKNARPAIMEIDIRRLQHSEFQLRDSIERFRVASVALEKLAATELENQASPQ